MKNVCFFNSTSFWGGGEKAHLEYAENFAKRGYSVWIVCSSGSVLEEKSKQKGLPFFAVKIGNLSFLNPFKRRQLKRFFRENHIDTVFLNSSADLKTGAIAAKKAGVKNIVYMRGLAVPVKNSFLNRYLLTKVVTHPVPNSMDTRKTFLTHLKPLLNEENVPVIYRGINFEEWDKRPVQAISYRENDEIILGNVGRLVEQKGQVLLIEIAKTLKKKGLIFKLIIAGSGPLQESLQMQIDDNGLNNEIKLIGFLQDVKSFLKTIDIFIFPSLWEGFGNAMVEAMVEKKVPVAFNLTSNPEIIENGKNGFLVEHPNLNEFANKIIYLANHPKIREQMGEKARESAISKFSFDKIMKDWEKLLG